MEGFPIRKSADITAICASPRLIAACHVLHRLPMPRHSPCALISLNSFFISFDMVCMSSQIGYFLLVVIFITLAISWKDLKFSVNNNLISFCLDLLSPIHFSMSAFQGTMNTHQKILQRNILSLEFISLVGSSRFELPTSRLSGARSNHLSYEPIALSRWWWR